MSTVIGRDSDVAAVRSMLDDGDRAGVLLTGEPGVGKTYLAEHIVRTAEATGTPVRRLYANTMTGELPLGLLAAGFEADGTFTEVAPTASVKRALTEFDEPPLILIDDVDALDHASAAILVDAADAGLAKLIVTLRAGSAMSPPVEHALTVGAFARFVCGNLDADATARLSEQLCGSELTWAAKRQVFTVTAGNPLYVRELIAAAVESGQLSVAPGGASLNDLPSDAPRLVDLVERRLASLEPDELEALRLVAAAGNVSEGVLSAFVEPEVIARLDRLGIVTTTLDGRRLQIRPAHPLHGEVLRSTMSALELRRLRAALASQITERGMLRSDDRFRLATWSLDGICHVEPEVLAEATLMAKAANDHRLGPRLAAAAFAAEPSAANARSLGFVLYNAARWDDLKEHFPAWRAVAESIEDRMAYSEIYATGWFWRGAVEQPLADFVAGLCEWPEGDARNEMSASAASLLITQGKIDEAVALAESLGELPPSVGAVRRAMTLGHGWRSQGRPLDAAALVTESLDFYRAFGPDVFALSDSVMAGVRIQALADAGEFAECDRLFADGLDGWHDAEDSSNVSLTLLAQAWSWYLRGNNERSVQLAQQSMTGFEADRQAGMARWALIMLALAHVHDADTTLAEKVIAEIDGRPDHPARIFDAYLLRARGWLAARNGFPDDAEQHFADGFELAELAGNHIAALGCAHDLLRVGRADAAVRLFAGLDASSFQGRFPLAQLRHLEVVATGGPNEVARLGDCATEFDRIGAPHLAAECATAAARGAHATPTETKRWLRRAAEFGGVEEPDLDGLAATATFTPREREVALLAVQGLTSREVADRLGISRRTVETHIANAYMKAGVHDRLGLVELLAGPSG